MATYLGVDLGATSVRAVVGDRAGNVVGTHRAATPRTASGAAVTEAVVDAAREACADAGVAPESVAAAGVGAVGPIDPAEGAAVAPANLPAGVGRIPLTGPLETLCATGRVFLHNDATAGAIGERFFADAPEDMVYLTLSTGIGAGAVVDGAVLSGWNGNAGEVGHVTVDPDGQRPCGCGGAGHWEAYCAGANIPDYARSLHAGEPTALPLDDDDFSTADVFAHAETDDLAARAVERIARWNAIGVATVVHVYAPQTVVVGGGVARHNADGVLEPLRERLPERVTTDVPTVRLTDHGDDAVVLGALASAITGGTGDRRN
ncbi:ROK family protein [Haloplanus halobius]|uniref:ROK family protein n=1 Tax=Haloplanus halobius TaxID=2934938 RepID=UPI00200E3129|nr:ROK family protein [Haloplanus sp. XH21]